VRATIAIANQSADAAHGIYQGVNGDTLEIEAEIDPQPSTKFGFKVRQGPSEETVIGGDRAKSVLFVDRTHSGDIGFDSKFPGRQAAPLDVAAGRTLKLHIFVDRCSVEVFGNSGEAVISDLIFPSAGSQRVELYSEGGQVRVVKPDVWRLKSAW
jgi:sucrose-6-phosphate hydrolase SacC (GH32 family)